MGSISIVDTNALPWLLPGSDWKGKVADGEPAVRYKTVEPEHIGTRVQIAEYEPAHYEAPHSHPTSEVLYLIAGSLCVGDDGPAGPGTAVFVDKDTVYGPIVAGPEGATFLRVELPD